jgi:hypothetical protein
MPPTIPVRCAANKCIEDNWPDAAASGRDAALGGRGNAGAAQRFSLLLKVKTIIFVILGRSISGEKMPMSKKRTRSLNHLPLVVPIGILLTLAGTARAGGAFDGTYKGSRLAQPGSSSRCLSNNNVTVIIKNNHFERRWGNANLGVDVAGDGTFHTEANILVGTARLKPRVVSIRGRIVGGNLEADMGTSACEVHLSLKKS